MRLKYGEMFESGADVILFTGNATVRKDGCLVMGRGAAKEALARFPGINRVLGSLIRPYNARLRPYGVLTVSGTPVVGIFQVKQNFFDRADKKLIRNSVNALCRRALTEWKDKTIALNFPGIGWGGRKESEVLPLLQPLPDNVEVWRFPE